MLLICTPSFIADDNFLCARNKDFSSLQNEVNTELEKVFHWLASNKLTLNISKSKFMMITNKQNIPDFCVKIDDSVLGSCKKKLTNILVLSLMKN